MIAYSSQLQLNIYGVPIFMQDVAKIMFYRKASRWTACVLMSGAIGTLTLLPPMTPFDLGRR